MLAPLETNTTSGLISTVMNPSMMETVCAFQYSAWLD